MKKQVYKVGDRVKIIHCESGESFSKRHNGQIGVIKHIWIEGYRKGWVSILLPNNECCITSKVSPLKPKKSKKKMEKKNWSKEIRCIEIQVSYHDDDKRTDFLAGKESINKIAQKLNEAFISLGQTEL